MRWHPTIFPAMLALIGVPALLIAAHARPIAIGPAIAPPPIAAAPAGTLDRALARRLFAIDVRDADPVEAVADAEPGGPPQIVGIVGRLPDRAVVLVRRASGGTRTLAIGESFAGWRLESIAPSAALFVNGDRRLRVELPAGDEPDQ